MRTFLAIALVLSLGVVALAEDKAAVGSPAPAFSLPDQAGKTVNLSDQKGKIVVLEWFNGECPFVVRHYKAGTMKNLAEKYADKGVVWLAINSTNTGSNASNAKWIEDHKLSYPILNDADGKVGKAYGAKTTPHLFIIDQQGKLVYAGGIDDDPRGNKAEKTNYVDKALGELTAGQAVATATSTPYGCSVKYAK